MPPFCALKCVNIKQLPFYTELLFCNQAKNNMLKLCAKRLMAGFPWLETLLRIACNNKSPTALQQKGFDFLNGAKPRHQPEGPASWIKLGIDFRGTLRTTGGLQGNRRETVWTVTGRWFRRRCFLLTLQFVD